MEIVFVHKKKKVHYFRPKNATFPNPISVKEHLSEYFPISISYNRNIYNKCVFRLDIFLPESVLILLI